MGTLGPGNFDNDTAADHMGILCDRLITEIEDAVSDKSSIGPDEYWGVAIPCNIELLVMLNKKYFGATLPDLHTALRWRDVYMSVWQKEIVAFRLKAGHLEARSRVLRQTFASLIRIIKSIPE